MKITELVAALNKAQQLVGDAPIILRDIEQGVETEFKAIEQVIHMNSTETPGSITITHGTPTAASEPASEPTAAGDPAEQPAAAAG